jgi:hypothetical protein
VPAVFSDAGAMRGQRMRIEDDAKTPCIRHRSAR